VSESVHSSHFIETVRNLFLDATGGTGGASNILKAQSCGEDARAPGGLVSNLPHPRVNKTKQHTEEF